MMQTVTVDFEAIKGRQRMGWEAGDYPRVGNTLQLMAERLVEAAADTCWRGAEPRPGPSDSSRR
jgi:hypothetical protein